MNITLQVPSETQAELVRRAANAGVDVSTFVLETLKDTLNLSDRTLPESLPYDQWHEQFRSWIGQHLSRNPLFDDSRENIYD